MNTGLRRWRARPVPVDDPLKEHVQHAETLASRAHRQRAFQAWAFRQPHREVLHEVAVEPGDRAHL